MFQLYRKYSSSIQVFAIYVVLLAFALVCSLGLL